MSSKREILKKEIFKGRSSLDVVYTHRVKVRDMYSEDESASVGSESKSRST